MRRWRGGVATAWRADATTSGGLVVEWLGTLAPTMAVAGITASVAIRPPFADRNEVARVALQWLVGAILVLRAAADAGQLSLRVRVSPPLPMGDGIIAGAVRAGGLAAPRRWRKKIFWRQAKKFGKAN